MSLCLLVPSRGRPLNAARLARAVAGTASPGYTTLVFVLDHDDPDLAGYVREIVSNLRLTAPDFDVTCDCPDSPLVVSADKQRVGQVAAV